MDINDRHKILLPDIRTGFHNILDKGFKRNHKRNITLYYDRY